MGETQFAFRMDEERRAELAEMSKDTGITAASIVRGAVYEKIAEWKASKQKDAA